MQTFTPIEKRRDALREVSQRQKVYRRLVHMGRMKQDDADYQIAIMRAIADDYPEQAGDQNGATLFDRGADQDSGC